LAQLWHSVFQHRNIKRMTSSTSLNAKRARLAILALFAILATGLGAAWASKALTKRQPMNETAQTPVATTDAQTVNVLELFTSEGCSSCPPADALLPQLQAKYGTKLLTLSFHVDYWNRLGWTDPFSSPQFSARQSAYARALNATSYTPQAVFNGTSHQVGGNRAAIEKTLDNTIQPMEINRLSVTAARTTANSSTITVKYETDGSESTLLNLALIQKEATTSVKRGENGGRELRHTNVVRSFTSVKAGNGQALLTIPKDLSTADLSQIAVVAYRQDAKTLVVHGGVQVGVR